MDVLEKKNYSFYIENLGCAKNQVDAETMIASLERAGGNWVQSPNGADLIIVNTCGFIRSAKEESIDSILTLQNDHPQARIIASGCLVQRYDSSLQGLLPGINGFFGNNAPEKINDMVSDVMVRSGVSKFPEVSGAWEERRNYFSYPGSAFVKVAEGCNNRCAYCSIPIIRGNLRSRPVKDIKAEIELLISSGVQEIVLVAQDLGSFGKDLGDTTFIDLLNAIREIKGDFWIRMLYLHPDHFPLDLLRVVKEDKRLLPYFDIPFQHSSEAVLARMGRKGSHPEYIRLIKNIREQLPEAVIRSTFLVGFPGEKKKDYEDLLAFQEEADLDWLGVFVFSREEDTPAFSYTTGMGQLRMERIAAKRKVEIEERQVKITSQKLDHYVGKIMEILLEEKVEEENLLIGRSFGQAPDVDGLVVVHGKDAETAGKAQNRIELGKRVRAKIVRRNGIDLEAILCD